MKAVDPELIRKFFEGKCTPEEVHQVLVWINSEQSKKDIVADFEDYKVDADVELGNCESLLSKIHEQIDREEISSSETYKGNLRRLESGDRDPRSKQWKIGLLASFFLTILASSVWLFTARNERESLNTDAVKKVDYITRQTRAGEKLTLKLNDGSTIQLNSNSKIKFPRFFTMENREVFLEGQAFFDVRRDESKPFIVHTKDLVTNVLGTSFTVLEDSINQLSEVAVLTGKVTVVHAGSQEASKNSELVLEPMDAASFDETKQSFEKIRVEYDRYFAWKDNVLVFHNENFEEVLIKLENWFGVKFQLKRKINDHKDYTGKFDDETLEEVLIGLSFTYDFKYKIKDSTIIIY